MALHRTEGGGVVPRDEGMAQAVTVTPRDAGDRAWAPALTVPSASMVATGAPDEAGDDLRQQAIARGRALLERARRQPDLPLLTGSARAVASQARAPAARLQDLADVVHADPALVWRLLRRANGALVQGSGGPVGDVPRALALLGSESLAQVAASGPCLDPRDSSPQSRLQGESWLRALIGSQLTQTLCDAPQLTARASSVGLAPHLGRMVVAVHAPQAALALRASRLVQDDAQTEEAAVRRHFGCGYDGIAQALGQAWGLPSFLQPVPAPAPGDWPRHRSDDAGERLRWLARMAHEASDLMLSCALPQAVLPGLPHRDTGPTPDSGLEQLSLCAARVLGLDPQTLHADLRAQRAKLPALMARIGLPPELLQPPQGEAVPGPLALLLQGLWRHLAPRRAVLLLSPHLGRQHEPHVVVAQRGLPLSAVQREAWQVDPWQGRDLYARLCHVGRLTLVADVMAPNLHRHLPPAFMRQPPGRHFLLLPLRRGGRPIGMIYLDRDEQQPFEIDDARQQQIVDAAQAAVNALREG